MWCTCSLRMLLLQLAIVRLRKLDAMPVLPPLPPTQATPRVGSSSSCPSVRLKLGDRPPTRAQGSAVSVCPATVRLGANQTGGWSEWIGIFPAVDRYGRRSFGPRASYRACLALMLSAHTNWKVFFIFYIAFSCARMNKTSLGPPGQLKLRAHFLATRGGCPY